MSSQLMLLPPPSAPREAVRAGGFQMRPYQSEAIEGIKSELEENRSTVAIMATGLGKTVIFCEVIKHWPSRCLVIAHRDELIQQAAKSLARATGERPEIEQAQSYASKLGGHVVASVQTLSRPDRLSRFDPDEFGLIVVDEVHHGTSPTYRRVMDHFAGAKVLGLTATPDRLDKQALGQVMDSVAYQYELPQAIDDGWLAPVMIRSVSVAGLDFSRVKTVAGDFAQGELDAVMRDEENLHAVARPAVELSDGRKTIIFTTSVAAATRMAEIVDRYAGAGAACTVNGKTPKDERRAILRKFDAGEHRFFINVGIATEGYDQPDVACIVMGRPTKSRALYAQMLGRGTRGGERCPVPGKSDCLVLDFVGNSGKHSVVTAADVLGGSYDAKELARAKHEIDEADEPMSLQEAMEKAREKARKKAEEEEKEARLRGRREHIQAEVSYSVSHVNPYVSFGVRRDRLFERHGINPATERQSAALTRAMGKHAKDLPKNLSKHEASRLLSKLAERREAGLCTYPQLKVLQRFGYDAKQWSFRQATKAITVIANNGWRVPE